ncbi:hypothetical protein MMC25_003708 [Agyrium rufum]|nr:hypothetical protein [Agyrium rufum]
MGSFLFKWEHPAKEVFVTGTFDDWGKTVQLEKKGDLFEKTVDLPNASEKIYYKVCFDVLRALYAPLLAQENIVSLPEIARLEAPFSVLRGTPSFFFVVDGEWITDHTAPQEADHSKNVNNVLVPGNITKSSTAAPIERTGSSDLPGSFPETPATEPQQFSVNPLPATAGIGNPINLREGEKVPESSNFTGNTTTSSVTTDQESYERGAPQLPDVVTPQNERDARGGGMFGLPEVSKNMIPESSLPMGEGGSSLEKDAGPHIQSVGANSTTAQLAGQVPLESPGVPEMVKESQREAHFDPEASGNAEAVEEKSAVEQELEKKVPEEPATSEGASTGGQVPLGSHPVPEMVAESQKEAHFDPEASGNAEAVEEKSAVEQELEKKVPEEPATSDGTNTGEEKPSDTSEEKPAANQEKPSARTMEWASGIVGGGTVAAASTAAYSAFGNKSAKPEESVEKPMESAMNGSGPQPIAATVPDVVQESIAAAHQSPEAAADKAMVSEKSAVESQLLSQIKSTDQAGEPAPTVSAALSETAPAPTILSPSAAAASIPSPPAAAMPSSPSMSESKSAGGLAAPSSAPAQTPAGQNAVNQAVESRDVSPMTRLPTDTPTPTMDQSAPMVTSGVGSSKAPETSSNAAAPLSSSTFSPSTPSKAQVPSKSTPSSAKKGEASSDTGASKRSKRASGFFGKLKEKFHDKDKDKKK